MDTGMYLLLIAFGIMLAGGATVFFIGFLDISNRAKGWTAFFFVLIASIIILAVCGNVLISGKTITGESKMFRIEALHASLHYSVDRLSAFFLILIVILALAATMFSVSYLEDEVDIRGYYTPLILFLLGMMGVLCVDDLFFFFIPWEFMSLSAYALILFNKRDPKALRAGIKYFIVTHFGTTCMFLGALIIYYCPAMEKASFSFASISQAMGLMMHANPIIFNLALGLFFIGLATKAGLFPFGFWWLPDAHPAAPSPISSLLSGAMIKIGVYGFIRIFIFLLPTGSTSLSWGWVIAIFGTLSLFLGTLRAMMQHDSKVLLAYHSIGQIGYITLGLGLGMIFIERSPLIALLGMIAGLYHLANHTCFKGLLFLNAGAVIHKSGLRDLDQLGGLSKILPVTSVATLIAVFSIAGLPGFSGFVSKWMIYQTSIMGGIKSPVIILMGIAAIFISVVTTVSVLKFYASMFLGHTPEPLKKLKAGEDIAIQIPQIFLAVLCILLGIIPILGILPSFAVFTTLPALAKINYSLVFGQFSPFRVALNIPSSSGNMTTVGVWNPLLTMIVFIGLGFFAYLISRSAKSESRTVDNWYCGSVLEGDEVIYRSSSYYIYLKEFFDLVNLHFAPKKIKIKTDFSKILNPDLWLYYPFSHKVQSVSNWLAKSHVGIPQIYLLWTVIGAVITIVVLFGLT